MITTFTSHSKNSIDNLGATQSGVAQAPTTPGPFAEIPAFTVLVCIPFSHDQAAGDLQAY